MRIPISLVAPLVALIPQLLPAVVIASGDGSGNTSAPVDQPGFSNVGTRGGASAIYLGGGWVMTANHVGAGSVVLNGTTYAAEAGTTVRLNNGGTAGMTVNTDIILFRLATDPGLPGLTIAANAPAVAEPVVMVGVGRSRATALTHWDVETSGDLDVWTVVSPPPPADQSGYQTTATKTLRWGENEISGINQNVNAGQGTVRSFFTTFDSNGLLHEGQGIRGDSGGAIFNADGELIGMMHAIGTFKDQPSDTAVFGNLTYAADLSFYRDQIVAIIPEPSAALMALAASTFFLTRRSRGQ